MHKAFELFRASYSCNKQAYRLKQEEALYSGCIIYQGSSILLPVLNIHKYQLWITLYLQ
jgi:hypothetical protein